MTSTGTYLSAMTSLRIYSSLFGCAAVVTAGVVYWVRSHRKTPQQREAERRQWLKVRGRIIDGTVLDAQEVEINGHGPTQLIIYSYDVGGVSYECSQDVTYVRQFLDMHNCVGLPASVKYDPHNPGNSIIVAEGWVGLRQNQRAIGP